jgi:hypothetical protein
MDTVNLVGAALEFLFYASIAVGLAAFVALVHRIGGQPLSAVPYDRVDDLVSRIEGANGEACRRLLAEHRRLFETVRGSTHNHQAWPGGYVDHVTEVMNVATVLFPALDSCRTLPFTLSDALLVLFLHDVEKPWKYEPDPEGGYREIPELRDKGAQKAFREAKLAEYGIVLTDDQRNALTYVEGEHKDYSNKRRVMNPLAAFCHLCDVTSARIWFDRPAEKDDPWSGPARRRVA